MERVVLEKKELDEKLNALNEFRTTHIFNCLDVAEQSRLKRQSIQMGLYSNVLGERIDAYK